MACRRVPSATFGFCREGPASPDVGLKKQALRLALAVRALGAQDVAGIDKDVVARVRSALAERMGRQRFDLWFGAQCTLSAADAMVRVTAASEFSAQFLRVHFSGELCAAAREVLGAAAQVEFDVAPPPERGPGDDPRPRERSERSPSFAQGSSPSPTGQKLLDLAGPIGKAAPAQHASADVPAPPPKAQARPPHALESFVAGRSNEMALAAARLVLREPGRTSPLFLHGPTACGKSHLLESVCRAVRQKRGQALYMTAEQFTTIFLASLHGTGVPSFRRKYQGLDLLAIDDVQFFVGKRATLGEVQQAVDAALREGRQLVLSADRPPSALAGLGRELQTRLQGGLVCGIDAPDRQVRLGIVAQLCRRQQLDAGPDVQEYIADHLTSHARQLHGAVNLLKAASLTSCEALTLARAERLLADLVRQDARPVRLADIEQVVCDVFGLEPEALRSSRKDQAVSRPRMLAMWLARKHTRAALSEIGRFFGGRKHSTVISAQKKVEGWMHKHEPLRLARESLSADETVRRVEERLRAG
jgi:chromosomal replication initiator protein